MVLVYAAPKLNSSLVTNVLFVQLEDVEGVLMRVELDPPLCILGNNYLILLSGRSLDCEQSLIFFRFSESNARAREWRSRETCETRAAAREEKKETARLARAIELSIGLTTQNTIG